MQASPGTEQQAQRLLRRVLLLRFATVVAILGAGFLVYTKPEDRSSLVPWFLLFGATTLFTAASWAALRSRRGSSVVVAAQLTADLAVAAAAVHLSGGYDSPFTFLYVLSVMSGAALLAGWGALIMGSAASAVYATLCILEATGVVVPPGSPAGFEGMPASNGVVATVLIQVLFFHATAAIAAHLAERTARQVRELRAKDLELREERLNTDTIIQSVRSGLMTVAIDGKIAHLNRAAEAILACPRGEASGCDFRDILRPRCPEFARGIEAALERGEMPNRLDAIVITPDRDPTPIGVSLSVLRTGEGDMRGVVAIFQDLTDVKKMDERIRRSDCLAAVGELSAAVAHEIRNPLATISGSVEILAAELEVTGDHRKLLDLIVRESSRLKRITADFLSYGRLKPKEVARTDVTALVREIAAHLQHHESFQAGHEIRVEAPADAVIALWDEQQMRQALLNIGANALEAMPAGGTLTIRLGVVPWETPGGALAAISRLPRAARLSFDDTGAGITAEAVRRVFEPFFTTKAKGTGLGLAIVARIVEDHGGLLDLRSHPGEGTSFNVTLPGVVSEPERELTAVAGAETALAIRA